MCTVAGVLVKTVGLMLMLLTRLSWRLVEWSFSPARLGVVMICISLLVTPMPLLQK
jgi:hypothetical protein